MTEPTHLTEYQIMMLRDAWHRGAVYFAKPEDLEEGMFPRLDDPKGYAITPHDRGQKRILRNLISMGLMREESPGRFVLTGRGEEYALHDGLVPVRRSY